MKLSDLANKLDCRLDSASAAGADVEITGVAGLEEKAVLSIDDQVGRRPNPRRHYRDAVTHALRGHQAKECVVLLRESVETGARIVPATRDS